MCSPSSDYLVKLAEVGGCSTNPEWLEGTSACESNTALSYLKTCPASSASVSRKEHILHELKVMFIIGGDRHQSQYGGFFFFGEATQETEDWRYVRFLPIFAVCASEKIFYIYLIIS
jgi:hypothetical protein